MTDEALNSEMKIIEVQPAILDALKPLKPKARRRVMRMTLAAYGFPLPADPELNVDQPEEP